MPATTKTQLLEATRVEFAKLAKLIETIEPATAMIKQADDTSIKDIVAHRAHWIDLFLGWYADGIAGTPVHFPAKGYKWNQLKQYNADLRSRQKALGWAEAKALLNAKHEALWHFIHGHSEAALYGGPMKGANNHWTPGRWAEAAGASHYRSATKTIRARLRQS